MNNKKEVIFENLSGILDKVIDLNNIVEEINLRKDLSCNNKKKIIIKYPEFIPYLGDLEKFKEHLNNEIIPKYKQEMINILVEEKYCNNEKEAMNKIEEYLKDCLEELNIDHGYI